MMRLYDRQQKELEEANNALHELNRMNTEFLQDIKHEIRNPLHVISLGTDYIHARVGTEGGAEEVRNALGIIQNEALRLGRMVNGMVELATMSESPKNREKVDFAALLRHCAETARLQAEQSKNTLRVELAPDLPYVYAEAEQLERVPVNLLSNAVNATENGEITLEVSCENNYITVRVRDTGDGISPDLLPRVFERGVSGKGGKGYGLAICKTIVEAHGGEIKIKSEQGKGTAVTFTIPVYGGQSEGRA
jgi:signal transduction histidine kinase